MAVIAVDPSSRFSGGATLGDRIRLLAHFDDPGIFVRSMASRGQRGGLSAATIDIAHVFDAAGFDTILIETLGVGQDEIDVTRVVDTSIMVQVPGLGDAVQTLKAGIMEVGDVIAVNKSDLPGANYLRPRSAGDAHPEPDADRCLASRSRASFRRNRGWHPESNERDRQANGITQ